MVLNRQVPKDVEFLELLKLLAHILLALFSFVDIYFPVMIKSLSCRYGLTFPLLTEKIVGSDL